MMKITTCSLIFAFLLAINISHSQTATLTNPIGYDLSNLNLSKIPDSIKQKESTTYVFFDNNPLLDIYSSFLLMTNLEKISVYACRNVEHNFPWYNFPKLSYLDISFCGHLFVPRPIGQIENLIELRAAGNSIDSISTCLFNLQKLQWLDLSENYGIIISNLSVFIMDELEVLYLSRCKLSNFEVNLNSYENIRKLFLNGNEIEVFQIESASLNYLGLNDNKIKEIPKCIKDLPSIEAIDLSFNEITKLDINVKFPDSLKWIDLTGNSIEQAVINEFRILHPHIQIIF